MADFAPFNVTFIDGLLDQPSRLVLPAEPGTVAAIMGSAGTIVVKPQGHPVRFLHQGGIVLVDRAVPLTIELGRGVNEWILFEAKAEHSPIMSKLIIDAGSVIRHSEDGSDPVFSKLYRLAITHIHDRQPQGLVLLVATAGYVLGAEQRRDVFCLASVPESVTGNLRTLVDSVVQQPAKDWQLKEASQESAYSPFHLSRSFKSMVGYGFPEFVERCRTSVAVGMLLVTELSSDEICRLVGFGSVQSMRHALRTHTGFLPSEIRNESACAVIEN